MSNSSLSSDIGGTGKQMHEFMTELYPLCRSITGDGVRKTLHAIARHIPLAMVEIPSGRPVFDWTIPREWNIRDAYVLNSRGERIIDFKKSNLHVLGYSIPVHCKVSLEELKKHLFSIPEHPDWIPHKTSYYAENWGFSLTHRQLEQLPDDEYEVVIDSSLENGFLTLGECILSGKSDEEILISCHVCHPSLCNDNLSGIALATYLARYLSNVDRHFTYRFLFMPATIGSIAWLALNEPELNKVKQGVVLTCVGDPGNPTYKKSRAGNALIDQAFIHVLKHLGQPYNIEKFVPYGYDERQYCSPGINLPVGCFMRTPHGQFPEYHTSADNLDFVSAEAMEHSLLICTRVISILEGNQIYLSCNPKCEPQLGRRGLYSALGGRPEGRMDDQLALLWVLNYSDGQHSLLDIAEMSGFGFQMIRDIADRLLDKDLLIPSA
jgi:aminopeptidase-like protein